MDNQPMPMPMSHMHNAFWRENQIVISFHSDTPLVSTAGINNAPDILKKLNLESQLQTLNQFLKDSSIDFTLSFFSEGNKQQEPSQSQPSSLDSEQKADSFKLPPGVYLYGLQKPIVTEFGHVQTSVVTFFNFNGSTSATSDGDPVVRIVNALNHKLEGLNKQSQVPITSAGPVWLQAGTPPVPQGCPLTPPLPLEDSSCAYWHYELPHLSPQELQDMKGDGVTVLILDTLPAQEVISKAVQKAGDDNLLLFDVSNTITYNYNFLSAGIENPGSELLAVGKDVYGGHYPIKIADHGLFIAGIVHDIVPKAKIECIRVLDDYCVGDLYMFLDALQYIENRMAQGGNLYQQPVVINMSLVMPTKEEAGSQGLDTGTAGAPIDVVAAVRYPIQCLLELGAIIAASAGNEADLREMAMGTRPQALYPAAFANPPDSMEGIIPVGAVDGCGKATSYSCYPGAYGIATYGGEVPEVDPSEPDPSRPLVVKVTDAVRGIYSSDVYPVLVAPQPPAPAFPVPEYPDPDNHAWAYWIGTSFATPVISAVAARILEMRSNGAVVPLVRNAILAAVGTDTTTWDRLDPATTGASSGSAVGPMLLARQICMVEDEDEDEEDEEVEVGIEVISIDVEEHS